MGYDCMTDCDSELSQLTAFQFLMELKRLTFPSLVDCLPCPHHSFSAVNETVIKKAADKLLSLGLAKAGYTYLNLDGECSTLLP